MAAYVRWLPRNQPGLSERPSRVVSLCWRRLSRRVNTAGRRVWGCHTSQLGERPRLRRREQRTSGGNRMPSLDVPRYPVVDRSPGFGRTGALSST